MKIIRPGIAALRCVPEQRPDRLGFVCGVCQCVFEADREETAAVMLYGNHGRIQAVVYTCCCPNCRTRLEAESFYYEKEE